MEHIYCWMTPYVLNYFYLEEMEWATASYVDTTMSLQEHHQKCLGAGKSWPLPSNTQELQQNLLHVWQNMDLAVIQNIIDLIPFETSLTV